MAQLIVAAASVAILALVWLLRLKRLRQLTGALVFTAIAATAHWLVNSVEGWFRLDQWADAALLLAIGVLIVRIAILVLFEWLLLERLGLPLPRLARDVVSLIVYLLMAAAVLRWMLGIEVGALLATSAVLTVVIGLALQETLGTLLAGLALAWEKRVETGVWVEVDGVLGRVEELGWRSLVLGTRLGERILIPNSSVARSRLRVLGRGERPVAVSTTVGVSYAAAPDRVKRVLLDVALGMPYLVETPAPQVLTHAWADSAVVYECRLWSLTAWQADTICDEFLTRAFTALERAGMEIPFPQRTLHMATPPSVVDPVAHCQHALASCALFDGLPEEAMAALAQRSRFLRFAPGEPVVRQGDESRALYVVAEGTAVVEHEGREVSRLGRGEVFGEIALLSGQPRAATVRALNSMQVVEVSSDGLAGLLARHRELADELATRMGARQQHLDELAREAEGAEGRTTLVGFLRERLIRLVGGEA